METVIAEIEHAIRTLEQVSTGKQTGSYAVKESGSVDISADECKKLCAKIGLKYFEGFERRIIQYKFTDATTDRYGDRITAKGVKLDKYKQNPIVLAFHNSWWFPVGASIKTWYEKSDDSVKGWVLFFDSNIDDSGFSESTFKFASTGAVKTGSIGFIPVAGKVRKPTEEEKAEYGMTDWGYIYDEIELLEYSIVPLPANPSSMAEPITKSFGRKDFDKTIARIESSGIFPEKQLKELIADLKTRNAGNKGAETVEDDKNNPAPVVQGTTKRSITINMGVIPGNDQMDSLLKDLEKFQGKGVDVTLNIGTVPAPISSEIVKAEPIDLEKLADLVHEKAGAVLSKKNKTLVKDTVSVLSKSLEALKELLKAAGGEEDDTDPAEEDNEDNDEGEDGTKKPKKGKATQTGSPEGDPTAVTPNPYGAKFFDAIEKANKTLSDAVKQ